MGQTNLWGSKILIVCSSFLRRAICNKYLKKRKKYFKTVSKPQNTRGGLGRLSFSFHTLPPRRVRGCERASPWFRSWRCLQVNFQFRVVVSALFTSVCFAYTYREALVKRFINVKEKKDYHPSNIVFGILKWNEKSFGLQAHFQFIHIITRSVRHIFISI